MSNFLLQVEWKCLFESSVLWLDRMEGKGFGGGMWSRRNPIRCWINKQTDIVDSIHVGKTFWAEGRNRARIVSFHPMYRNRRPHVTHRLRVVGSADAIAIRYRDWLKYLNCYPGSKILHQLIYEQTTFLVLSDTDSTKQSLTDVLISIFRSMRLSQ